MTTTDPSLPAHSPIGASTLGRLIECPASYLLSRQAGVPASGGSSIYAATGTVAHALIEEAMSQGYDPGTQLDEKVTVDGHDVVVDAAMIEGTRICVAEYQRLATGADVVALETRVCLDDYWTPETRPNVSAFGTADFYAYHRRARHVDMADYKNGAGIFVDVTNNPQLHYYAAGVLLKLRALDLPVATVSMTIVQPNVRGSEKIRVFKTSAVDVLMWVEDVLKPTVAEAMAPGARISAGTHCRFCPARAGCPALSRIAQDLARRDFGPSPDQLIELSDAELGKVLSDAFLVEVHTNALLEVAMSKIKAGTHVPGWGLVPSRPVRTWGVDGDALVAAAPEAAVGLLYSPSVLRTPAALEKLLDPEDWAVLRPYVQSKSSGVRLVPDVPDPLGSEVGSGRATAADDFA